MVTAKFTSFFGGLIYLVVFGIALFFSQDFRSLISTGFGVENQNLMALLLASFFLVSVGNFCFSYFIQQRESYHEDMDNAFFFSLQLLIIPIILFIGYIVVFANLGQ